MILGENLKKVNAAVEKTMAKQCKKTKDKALLDERKCNECDGENCCSVKCFYKDMETDDAEIVQWAAGAITDYRKMYTILNEYSLAVRLYFSNNRKKLTCRTAKQILAFYIYKHVWPKDYQKLIGNSAEAAFLTGQLTDGGHEDLFLKLYEAGLLNMDSLYYSGFSRERIAELWKKRLEGVDVKKVIDAMIQAAGYNYSELQTLVRNRCDLQIYPNSPLNEDALAAAIRFVLMAPKEQRFLNSWFFKNRDSDVCLQAMTKLTDENIRDFITRCKTKTEEEYNIFAECSKKGGIIVHSDNWTKEMAKVYAWGVHPKKRDATAVMIKGEEVQFAVFDS